MSAQQIREPGQFVHIERSTDLREIPVLGRQPLQAWQGGFDRVVEPGKAGTGEGGRTAQLEDFGHGRDGREVETGPDRA